MSEGTAPQDRTGKGANTDLLGGAALLAINAVVLAGMWGEDGRSWIFPNVLFWVLLVIAVLLLIKGFLNADRAQVWLSRQAALSVLAFVAGTAVFVWAVPRFGFWLPSFVLLVAAMTLLGQRRRWTNVAINVAAAAILVVLVYVVFFETFNVRLPVGNWWSPIDPGAW